MIDLTFNNFTADQEYKKPFFEKVLSLAAITTALGSTKMELSINLVGEDKIKTLNKQYRGKNAATDVLSFPLHEKIDAKSNKHGIISLGDIFICSYVARKYSEKDDVSMDYELSFLTIHGFLHLLGYDHEKSTQEKEKMFALQDNILKKCANKQ